ncbi:SDR family oxidoreductase [Streptomyces tricolor]|nr:SDR family oxidoreductase [Streptomyces tricolor]
MPLTVAADITRRDDVERVRTTVLDAFGHVDVLVNNAGYASRPQPFAEWDPDDWWQVIETNLAGTRAAVPGPYRSGMLARPAAVTSSTSTPLQGPRLSGAGSPTASSKAGLMRLYRRLGRRGPRLRGDPVRPEPRAGAHRDDLGRPDLDAPPESAWSPPEAAAEKLAHPFLRPLRRPARAPRPPHRRPRRPG